LGGGVDVGLQAGGAEDRWDKRGRRQTPRNFALCVKHGRPGPRPVSTVVADEAVVARSYDVSAASAAGARAKTPGTIATAIIATTAPGATPRLGERAMARLAPLSKCAHASRMSRSVGGGTPRVYMPSKRA